MHANITWNNHIAKTKSIIIIINIIEMSIKIHCEMSLYK